MTDNVDLRHHKNQLVTITGGVVACYDYRNPFLYDRVAGMVISAPPLQIDNVVCDVELTPYVKRTEFPAGLGSDEIRRHLPAGTARITSLM
ncbi:hypothetical protein ERYG_00622 [Escherichia coli M114]|nr:hypothetical protein ERYG_00622 [Escherichia coli M114]